MFIKKLKQAAAKKVLENSLKNQDLLTENDKNKISSFACILNVDEFNHTEVFYELAKELGLRQDQFKMIGFTASDIQKANFSVPVFSPDDLGWNGKIENGDIREFLDKEYDLLLNYYEEAPLILSLASVYTKAKFRVGLKEKNEKYNNMILGVAAKEFLKFKPELLKYLSILKKI